MVWIAVSILLAIAQVNAAEPDAVAISANIQARHLPFGTVLDPFYASATNEQITGKSFGVSGCVTFRIIWHKSFGAIWHRQP